MLKVCSQHFKEILKRCKERNSIFGSLSKDRISVKINEIQILSFGIVYY